MALSLGQVDDIDGQDIERMKQADTRVFRAQAQAHFSTEFCVQQARGMRLAVPK